MSAVCPACYREQHAGLLANCGLTCDNGGGLGGVGSTGRGLTHLLDLGERGLAVKATQVCSIPDCEKQVRARGWCATHHQRWRVHGDPNLGARRVGNPLCAASGCRTPARGRYCEMHRARLMRNGSLDLPPRADRHAHSQGYVIVKRPGHPIAVDPRGWVYEHRVVLFDLIGPGWHPCHHCGMQVSWELTYPEHPDALVVDHLDEDKVNNDPANLVPSCAACNFARSNRWVKKRRRMANS